MSRTKIMRASTSFDEVHTLTACVSLINAFFSSYAYDPFLCFYLFVLNAQYFYLQEENENEQPSGSNTPLKNVVSINKSHQEDLNITEPIGIDEHDHPETYPW